MRSALSSSPVPQPLHLPSGRGRLFRQPVRAYSGAVLLAFAFIAFGVFAVEVSRLFLSEDRVHAYWSLGGLIAFGFFRILAFIVNRSLQCSLCHGPILHEKRCHKHADATRLPGLSHRATTALALILTTSFRCMYCGTAFRLKK